MSTTDIVGIVIAVIVVAIFIAATARIVLQRRALKERFGNEYDRVVAEKGGRAAAEGELRLRQRRHSELPLIELSAEARAQFAAAWTEVQSEFVDDPAAAVQAADRLVSRVVADRGYPVVDYSDRLAHLSVDHAHVLGNYRDAHEISVRNDAGHATTEELRQALVHYRALVSDLLGDPALNHTAAALTNSAPASRIAADGPASDTTAADVVTTSAQVDDLDDDLDDDREPTLVPDASTPIEEKRR